MLSILLFYHLSPPSITQREVQRQDKILIIYIFSQSYASAIS
jgi:hypothetical protein